MLLFVAAPFFLFVVFGVKQKIIQHQMLEQLESASLQTITINKVDITWVKKNKEIIVNGKLFDVKSYTVAGDKIILTGLYDDDEDKLKKEFANLMHQKKNEPAPLEQLVLKFILIAVINQNQQTNVFTCNQNTKLVYPFHSEVAVYQSVPVTNPPPNV